MYEDETTVAYISSVLSELENRVNGIFEKLIDWYRFNKLALRDSTTFRYFFIIEQGSLKFCMRM